MKTVVALVVALALPQTSALAQVGPTPIVAATQAVVEKFGGVATTDIVRLSFHGQKEFAGERLQELAGLRNLLSLDLSGTGIADAGLANLKALPGLRELDLSQTAVTDEGLVHVASLKHLRRLRLRNTRVRGLGLIELWKLANLEELDFKGTPLADEGVKLLKLFPQLTALSLEGTRLTRKFSVSPKSLNALTHLERVNLRGTDIATFHFSTAFQGRIAPFRVVWVSDTLVDKRFLQYPSFMPELSDLAIDHTRITAADMMKFKEMKEDGKLQKLKVLHVSADQINDEIRAMFATSFPGLEIIVEKDAP